MNQKYLGDSFDIVKRFWADRLVTVAPLLAHPLFIPADIRGAFTGMVGMPVLEGESASTKFGLFMDPDTGIPLPTARTRSVTVAHCPVSFIVEEFGRLRPRYVVCFDRSYARGSDAKLQRVLKLKELRRHGLRAFYYVSHAPFLFIARDDETLGQLVDRLIKGGVPASRFEQLQSDSVPPGESRAMPASAVASVTVPVLSRMMCPACGKKEFKRWPLGWDAHVAHSCEGLAAGQPEARKAEFKNRFVHLFKTAPGPQRAGAR